MTSPMIERMAIAMAGGRDMWGRFSHAGRKTYRDLARIGLTAVRDPTQYMINSGSVARYPVGQEGLTEDIWRAMVDAALEEGAS